MTKEEIHDSQIYPLLAQIIDICKANGIAMLTSFHLRDEEQHTLHSTTAIGDLPIRMVVARDIILDRANVRMFGIGKGRSDREGPLH